jgi:hypothetical protein
VVDDPLNSGTINLTMRWLLDNQPRSGLITQTVPFTFSYSRNTTGTADGTHVITLARIDGTVRSTGNLRPMGMPVIVQNSGAINRALVVSVTRLLVHHSSPGRQRDAGPDVDGTFIPGPWQCRALKRA